MGMWTIGEPGNAGITFVQMVREEGIRVALAFEAPLISQRRALERGLLATCLDRSQPLILGAIVA